MINDKKQEMTVKDLPVDIDAKLNGDVRNRLTDMIQIEFQNRVNVDQIKKNEAKKKVVEKYKASLGITDMLKEKDDLKIKIQKIESKIQSLGFSSTYGEYQNNNSDVEKELDKLNQVSAEIQTIKHKLQTRLLLATTVGEATVIMHEILGNNLIPTLKINAIEFKK